MDYNIKRDDVAPHPRIEITINNPDFNVDWESLVRVANLDALARAIGFEMWM